MLTNNSSSDFFELDFHEAIKQYTWIQPHIVEVAKELSVVEFFQDLIVEVVFADTKAYFHMLNGIQPAGVSAVIKIPDLIFRQLLLTNFGRWLTINDFVNHICSEYSEFYHLDIFLLPEFNQLKMLCELWYKVHYLAAKRFFDSDENLRSYFADAKFLFSWQNEVAKSKHLFYLNCLAQKIQTQDKTILDVGSGFGRLQSIYESAKEVINVDISQSMLSKAQELSHLEKVKYCQADINNLPFENSCFDLIIALQIMMHMSNPFKTLKYLSDFLKSGGEIWTDFTCDRRFLDNFFYQESFFTRIYSREYVTSYCDKMGFSVSKVLEIPDRHDHYWLVLHLVKN
ncbi:class I SAM-dependent methyltransferase [Fischerella sp. PCC 9605]|uniref:class I SAM-dependent methyltransferase n=1 Tax=Fischerella sp. PCC 9605 TaxID=1173024 RepID=UPI00047B7A32|nr:class I SAM-dependent methyltransferase [Fischerella sp. PCC 9605]